MPLKVSIHLSSVSVGTLEISYIVLKKKGYDVIWCKEHLVQRTSGAKNIWCKERVSRFSFYFLTFTHS